MSTQRKPRYVAEAPLWLSYKGAMQMFDIGETTVRRLIREGKVEARRQGNRIKIRTQSLERYMATLPSPTASPHPARTAASSPAANNR